MKRILAYTSWMIVVVILYGAETETSSGSAARELW